MLAKYATTELLCALLNLMKKIKDLLSYIEVVNKTVNVVISHSYFAEVHGLVLKCVPHVKHAYFCSLDQSNSQFVTLSMLLTSTVLKLLIYSFDVQFSCLTSLATRYHSSFKN